MFTLELCHVVNVFINDDPQIIRLLVRRNGVPGEYLGHGGLR